MAFTLPHDLEKVSDILIVCIIRNVVQIPWNQASSEIRYFQATPLSLHFEKQREFKMKKSIRNKHTQIQESSKETISANKEKCSPLKSQVFRNNQWVDPSSSSSSSDDTDTDTDYK